MPSVLPIAPAYAVCRDFDTLDPRPGPLYIIADPSPLPNAAARALGDRGG